MTDHRYLTSQFLKNTGCLAVEIAPGAKRPEAAWDATANSYDKTLALIERKASTGLGLHLFGQIVDVDMDAKERPELLTAALDFFLPHCNHVWGRKSKPRSHRVYAVDDPDGFTPTDWPMLRPIKKNPKISCEVRGGDKGSAVYSVLPGATHPSGELYEWAAPHNVQKTLTVVSSRGLINAVRLACLATVVAHFWTEGIRQEMVMALAGFLHRIFSLGQTEEFAGQTIVPDKDTAVQVVRCVLHISDDDPADARDRLKAFEITWRKAANDEKVTGAARIAELVSDPGVIRVLYALACDSKGAAVIDEFLTRYAILYNAAENIDLERLSPSMPGAIKTKAALKLLTASQQIEVPGDDGKPKKVSPVDILYKSPSAVLVHDVSFRPGAPKVFVNGHGLMYANLWCGFAVPPTDAPVTDEEVSPFLDYLHTVVSSGDETVYRWAVSWMADIFQRPTERPGTALVLIGAQGTGKTFLGECILGPIIGEDHYIATSSVENAIGQFNGRFGARLLIQCDEATHSTQHKLAAQLKAFITDTSMRVENKNQHATHLPAYHRVYFTSNDDRQAVFITSGMDDRRFTVVEVNPKRRGDLDYWGGIRGWCADRQNLAKVHRWFLQHQYDPTFIRRPILTEAKRVMQETAWDPFDVWLRGALERGHPLSDEVHQRWYYGTSAPEGEEDICIRRDHWPRWVDAAALHADYVRSTNGRGTLALGPFCARLRREGLLRADAEDMRRVIRFADPKSGAVSMIRVRLRPAPCPFAATRYLNERYGASLPEPVVSLAPTEPEDDGEY